MDDSTHFALQLIVEALHESGAIGERNVRQIIASLRDQRGTFGGPDDASISSSLKRLADAIEKDLDA
jgi:hypothetical protein